MTDEQLSKLSPIERLKYAHDNNPHLTDSAREEIRKEIERLKAK